jgi:hypothetical protein
MSRTLPRTSATLRKRARALPPPTGLEAEQPIVLRLPLPILSQVDEVVKARPIRTPRHTWLLEAVWEKLAREQP